ncbi:kinesin-domain-containing protein [Auricularia subglabra TFB-10046 SS5]|nr:kinesin-domain-containing protein [Auricularia subglabra TFB-10046 SS5]
MAPPPTPTAPKRTTRAAAKAATTTKDPPSTASTTATKTVRKPLLTRNNTQASVATPKPRSKAAAATPTAAPRITINGSAATGKPALTKQASAATVSDSLADKEPVKAYLRIRPHAQDYEESSTPYLTALSPTSVEMLDPSPGSRLRMGSRATYTFSRVFAPETTQSDFFRDTTLPLVRGVLDGESGLLFTYGVTNSGKTYTIQGADGAGQAGLLPRTLDVLFNSIEGLQSNAPFKPVRLNDVEYDPALDSSRTSHLSADSTLSQPYDFSTLKADQTMLGGLLVDDLDVSEVDDTALKVDRNYEYAIWISYAEVYNEKIFDLLGDQSSSASTGSTSSTSTLGPSTSSSFFSSFSSFASTTSLAALSSASSENPLLLKRRALTLKNDPDGGKYIAGLREVRVRTREEAKAVVRLGQLNRRVFGTLANSASSRSHGIFTAKVVRVHGGSPNDKDSIHTARLSIVDLAGSERTKNTQNTGERLKEAGNINKSLMVLGQCMEVLRTNQRRIAAASGNHGALRMAVVPFRHSKLTEIFMDFFVGGGRAVMIVNVNPYDTGFDENSHVMKFASLARDVSTSTAKRGPANVLNAPPSRPSTTRRVTVSLGGRKGKRGTEAHLEIVEAYELGAEDEEATAVEEDEPLDGLVEVLFEQLQEMRVKLYEAELRAATIESDVREEIIAEMEERMNTMSRMHTQRLMTEMEENELKTDRKIDMLHRAGVFSEQHNRAHATKTSARGAKRDDDDDDDSEEEVGSLLSDASRVEDEGETFDLGADSDSDVPEDDESGASDVPPSSPTPATPKARKKTLPQEVRVPIKRESTGSEVIGLLPTDNEEDDAETSQTEDDDNDDGDDEEGDDVVGSGEEDEDDAGDDVNETYEEGEDDDEDEDQYPRSMLDDADADGSIMWENSFRHSTGSEFSASGLSMDGGSEFSGSPSPSPPPTVKKVPAKKSLSIVKPKRAASSRAVRVEESEDELLLSPPPPKRATRSSNRMK